MIKNIEKSESEFVLLFHFVPVVQINIIDPIDSYYEYIQYNP